jgi:hypothetical protein
MNLTKIVSAAALVVAGLSVPLAASATSYIHPGAFCSVHGQHGVSKTHKSYWCEPKGGHDRWEPTR